MGEFRWDVVFPPPEPPSSQGPVIGAERVVGDAKVDALKKEIPSVGSQLGDSSVGESPAAVLSGRTVSATPPPDLQPDLRKAKKDERSLVLGAYSLARSDIAESDPDTLVRSEIFGKSGFRRTFVSTAQSSAPTDGGPPTSSIADINRNYVARVIIREAKKGGKIITEVEAKNAADTLLVRKSFKEISVLASDGSTFTLGEKTVKKFYGIARANAARAQKHPNKDYKELCLILQELDTYIETASSQDLDRTQLAEANKKILSLLRKAIQSDAYQFLCHDESIPAIAYVHRMVMASFISPTPLTVYQELGTQTLRGAQESIGLESRQKATDGGGIRNFFSRILQHLRKSAQDQHLTASDKSAEYFLSHSRVAFAALKGETRLFGQYDPKMAENASGTLFTQTVGSTEVSAVYSPTPTLGDKVSPEAEAFLQALENRQFMSDGQLQKEPKYARQTHWSFASLQNRTSGNEGPRARAIMALNREFPLSFTGITIDQDSEFYRDGVEGSSDEEIERQMVKHGRTQIDGSYKDMMMDQLIDGAGYDLPVMSRENLEKAYRPIVEKAFEVVSAKTFIKPAQNPEELSDAYEKRVQNEKQLWQWRQKAAFRELVNLGVMRYWQLKSLPAQRSAVVTCCCKECIDRGGKVMAEFLWALGDGSDETLKQVFSALQGRALLARRRIILPARLEPFIALAEFVSQKDAQEFLNEKVGGQAMPGVDLSAVATPASPPAV